MPLFQDKKDAAVFVDPETGKRYQLNDVYEGAYYDTVNVAGTPDASYKVFRDLSNKNKQHTNLSVTKRVPGEHAFVLQRIGADVLQALGSTLVSASDLKEALYNGFLEMKLGSRLIGEGPLVDFPPGRGVTGGYGSDTSAASNHALTNGVPSMAANPVTMQPQLVDDKKDLNAEIKFDGASWVTSYSAMTFVAAPGIAIQVRLFGLISKPITA